MRTFDPAEWLSKPWFRQWGAFIALVLGTLLLLTAGYYLFHKSRLKLRAQTGAAIVLAAAPLLCGGYFLWSSAVLNVLLAGLLLLAAKAQGRLILRWNGGMMVSALIPLCYLVVCLWAVDPGQAFFGVVKYVPVPLFYLLLMQTSSEERRKIIGWLPLEGAGIVAVTGVLQFVPILQPWLQVNHRLAGTFQYPNAFAAYLLCMCVCLLMSEWPAAVRVMVLSILVCGIALTGSRTALGVGVFAALAVLLLYYKSQKDLYKLIFPAAGALISGVVILACTGGDVWTRFLINPLQSSTFLGRLMYAKDAFAASLSHPFGMGYGGYYYVQGSFQTGVYSTQYVHNEFLQLVMDIGWVPAGIVAAWLAMTWLRSSKVHKLLMLVLILHSLFDFDMQFLSLVFLLILAAAKGLEQPDQKLFKKRHPFWARTVVTIACALGIAAAAADTEYSVLQRPDLTLRIYPVHTPAKLFYLTQQTNAEKLDVVADSILRTNRCVSLAYSAKANIAYTSGNGQQMIEYKRKAIDLAKYSIEEYEDFGHKLYTLAEMYRNAGMEQSTVYCLQQLTEIEDDLKSLKDDTSSIAWKLADVPQLDLSPEMQSYIEYAEAYV